MSISRMIWSLFVLSLVAACSASEPASIDIEAARITEPVSYTHLTLPTTPYV